MPLLLRAPSPLLLRRHPGDYAVRLNATAPPSTTVWTTSPARWYATWRQSEASRSTMSAAKPGRRRPIRSAAAEDVRGVRRRRDECLLRRELHLRTGEREDEREAVAERAAGVEVRREGDQRRPRRRARVPAASGGRGRGRWPAGAPRSRRSRRAARRLRGPSPRGGRPSAPRGRSRARSHPTP